jgi:hypothetical protein
MENRVIKNFQEITPGQTIMEMIRNISMIK